MARKQKIAIYTIVAAALVTLLIQTTNSILVKNARQAYPSLEEFVLSTINKCSQKDGQCLKESAELLLLNASLDEVMTVLENHINEPDVFNTCHQITHEFGRIEYEKNKDIRTVLGGENYACYEGYFHGATEAYLLDKNISLDPNEKDLWTSVPMVCGQVKDYLNSDLYVSCLHGLGHGLMYITNGEVPLSLKLCDELKTDSDRRGCYSGVFMENRTNEFSIDHPSKYIRAGNPAYPCTILESKYGDTCYGYQAVGVYINSGLQFAEAVKFCISAPKQHQIGCINQVSGHMTGYLRTEESLAEDCKMISNKQLEETCIISIAKRFIQRDLGNLKSAMRFCAALPNTDRQLCITNAEISAQMWQH